MLITYLDNNEHRDTSAIFQPLKLCNCLEILYFLFDPKKRVAWWKEKMGGKKGHGPIYRNRSVCAPMHTWLHTWKLTWRSRNLWTWLIRGAHTHPCVIAFLITSFPLLRPSTLCTHPPPSSDSWLNISSVGCLLITRWPLDPTTTVIQENPMMDLE